MAMYVGALLGEVDAVFTKFVSFHTSVEIGETLTMLNGFWFAISANLFPLMLESDCATLVNHIRNISTPLNELGV